MNNLGGNSNSLIVIHNPCDYVERYITSKSSEDKLKLCLSTGSQSKQFQEFLGLRSRIGTERIHILYSAQAIRPYPVE